MIAKTILEKYMEYVCFWDARHGAKNPPSEVLQRQLCALMKAVDIFPKSTSKKEHSSYFHFFETGTFLKQKTHTKKILTPLLQEFIDDCIEESEFSGRLHKMQDTIDHRKVFTKLLSYRIKIERLYTPEGIRFEGFGSFTSHFYSYQKKILLEPLKENLKTIDAILCILIDPTSKDMDEKTLISEFGYPTEDLDSIATDWFIDIF